MENISRSITLKLVRASKHIGITGVVKQILPFRLKAWTKTKTNREFVSVDELKPELNRACRYLSDKIGKESIGDYLEFGVCHGTSLNCMYQVLQRNNLEHVRIFGFDSFEGLPELDDKDDRSSWRKGQFNSDIEITKYFLSKNGIDWDKTFLIKGWFSGTLNENTIKQYDIEKASIIMVDCDIYSAAKEALNFCQALIKDVAIIIFDDWNSGNLTNKNKGEKLAFTEFLSENPHLKAEEFGSYCYMGKPNGVVFKVLNTENNQS